MLQPTALLLDTSNYVLLLLVKHLSAESSSFGLFPSSSVGSTEVAVAVHVVVALVLFSIGCKIVVVIAQCTHDYIYNNSKMFNYISKHSSVSNKETFHEYPLAREVAILIHRCCSL